MDLHEAQNFWLFFEYNTKRDEILFFNHQTSERIQLYVSESRLKRSTNKVSFDVLTPSPLSFRIRKETLQAFNINNVY
jgi:hypothetical protein